jgi:hypothetical protein
MPKPQYPIHGIRRVDDDNWEVWSLMLRGNVQCESAADAKRVAMAMETRFPLGAAVDYSEANAAIGSSWLARVVAAADSARNVTRSRVDL